MSMTKILFSSAAAFALLACVPDEAGVENEVSSVEEVAETVEAVTEKSPMEIALGGDWRVAPERDAWRNPAETLEFFGVKSSDTVVEIWPGGGWYTSVLGPYLKTGGGKLLAASFNPDSSDWAKKAVDKFTETFVSNPDTYGEIVMTIADQDSEALGVDGNADVVLTFRNVHNWMARGYSEKMFEQSFKALKPGGILGVVEHRLPSAAEQDPAASSGYVHESLVIQYAKEAGFEFDGSSEVNANPADTADHPFGVWTLPPTSRYAAWGEEPAADFDGSKYLAIGESDRMTLKFIKPAAE